MNKPNPANKQVIWWVLWLSFLVGIVQIYFILEKSVTSSTAKTSLDYVGIIPFIVSSLIRWFVLPKIQKSQPALVAFVVGIAVAESSCFFGLFLFPAHKQELFYLSVLGIAQFAPFFARRFCES